MGRRRRMQFPGACYLVELRGNNRQEIFLSNQDRRFFLELLKRAKERQGLKVYAWCLLPDSATLLLETARPNLSRVMQGIGTVYTKRFHGLHHTTGHLFQGRYKALVVDKEGCLPDVTAFVHLAPVRHGLKESPWRYLWSSCAAYVESGEREPLVDSAAVLRRFAKNRLKQSVKYLQFIRDRMRRQAVFSLPVSSGAVGGREFASELSRLAAGPSPAREPAGPDPARRILAELRAKGGVTEEQLSGRGCWRELSALRREAIHRLWKEAELGVTEIARILGRTPSAVSQALRSMEWDVSGREKS